MRKKSVLKALNSKRPMNALFCLIPEKKKQEFFNFARQFGYSTDDIKGVLEKEKNKKSMLCK